MSESSARLKEMLGDRIAALVWWPISGGLRGRVRRMRERLAADNVDLEITSLHRGRLRRAGRDVHHAAVLPHLEQVHVDLSRDLLERRVGAGNMQDQMELAAELLHRASGEGPAALVLLDHSAGSLEGTVKKGSATADPGRPWWLKELIGKWPEDIPSFRRWGDGIGVAVVDHPADGSHPALHGKMARPLEAWAMPHYPRVEPVWDDHGTGACGLVAGWEKGRSPVGVAPSAHLHPVHLWPDPSIKGAPDRIRILCRALELTRQRQLRPGKWAPIRMVTQQFTVRGMRSARGTAEDLEKAMRILEAACARAAGGWGLPLLVSAGSNPRAVWPVWPSGLAGTTPVGAIDRKGEYVRRSPQQGVELVVAVSDGGAGVHSAAAGGGYVLQGYATSTACPLAAGVLAAVVSEKKVEPRRALRIIRRRGQLLPGGATRVNCSSVL